MRTRTGRGEAAVRTGSAIALGAALLAGCQGSTAGSTAPPSSGTIAMTPPESPAAGPPAPTAAPGTGAPGAEATATGAVSAAPPDPSRAVAGAISVAQVSAMAPGSKATVRGLYFGWRGPCKSAPPTRSAWQLADADQKGSPCLYVDGPVPPGLDPAGRGAPTWVRVDAELVTAGPSTFLTAQHAEKETP